MSRKTCFKGVVGADVAHHIKQSVDNCIAGNEDTAVGYALREEVGAGLEGGCEVDISDCGGKPAVNFFGPGGELVMGAQTRLHVADLDFGVVSGKAGGERGSGVAVNEDNVGHPLLIHLAHAKQDVASNVREILVGLHDVKVEIWANIKEFEHLIEHLAVLSSYADFNFEGTISGDGLNYWGHFDGFRSGSKNSKYFHLLNLHKIIAKTITNNSPFFKKVFRTYLPSMIFNIV